MRWGSEGLKRLFAIAGFDIPVPRRKRAREDRRRGFVGLGDGGDSGEGSVLGGVVFGGVGVGYSVGGVGVWGGGVVAAAGGAGGNFGGDGVVEGG